MTDEIDLDEFDSGDEEEAETTNEGDPIWGPDDDSPTPSPSHAAADGSVDAATESPDASGDGVDTKLDDAEDASDSTDAGDSAEASDSADSDDSADAGGSAEVTGSDPSETRVPHVPYEDSGRPAGIPTASGGSGGGAGVNPDGTGIAAADGPGNDATEESSEATGPHGETTDDLTLAFTYEAVTRFADPAYVFSDANAWADWLGIVGDVPTPAINKFQREHGVDADFFGGAGTGPRARLRDVDEHSMFDAERLVLVGCADADEADWAPEGWEFVPLSVAAEEAGWSLR